MTRIGRAWRRTRLYRWIQRHRADRQMPPPLGRWTPGGPLTVYLHPELSTAQMIAVRSAAKWWCNRFGRLFYVRHALRAEVERWDSAGNPPARAVLVRPGAPLRSNALPHTPSQASAQPYYRKGGHGMFGAFEIRLGEIDGALLFGVVAQELGHALGLADNIGGAPELLMATAPYKGGTELLPKECEFIRKQWPPTDW